MLEPGDQKNLLPDGDLSGATYRLAFASIPFILGAVILGALLLRTEDWLSGVLIVLGAAFGGYIVLKPVIAERRMLKRMREREGDKP